MDPKPIWQSKTFWFNVIATGLDVLALTELGGILPKEAAAYITVLQGIGNILLRRISSGPVTLTGRAALEDLGYRGGRRP
jgi:hypothetical protein